MDRLTISNPTDRLDLGSDPEVDVRELISRLAVVTGQLHELVASPAGQSTLIGDRRPESLTGRLRGSNARGLASALELARDMLDHSLDCIDQLNPEVVAPESGF